MFQGVMVIKGLRVNLFKKTWLSYGVMVSIGLSLNVLQLKLSDGVTVSKFLRINLFDRLGYHSTLW